jgi:hypothetical protein
LFLKFYSEPAGNDGIEGQDTPRDVDSAAEAETRAETPSTNCRQDNHDEYYVEIAHEESQKSMYDYT